MRRVMMATIVALSLGYVQSAQAAPIVIEFEALDLADVNPGDDLWRYRYFVSGDTFDKHQGFSVYFDHTRYSGLENPPPSVNVDWDTVTFQPDRVLLSDGLYDALALSNDASLADPFEVNFVWRGPGTPGSQPFDINQWDATGEFLGVLASGATTPYGVAPIPEPGTLLLVALGGVGLLHRRDWRRQ